MARRHKNASDGKRCPLSMVFLAGFVSALMFIYIYLGFIAHTHPSHGVHPTMPSHAFPNADGLGGGRHPTLPLVHPNMVTETPPRPAGTREAGPLEARPPATAPPPLLPTLQKSPQFLAVEQEMLRAATVIADGKKGKGDGDDNGGTRDTKETAAAAASDKVQTITAAAARDQPASPTIKPRKAPSPPTAVVADLQSQPGPGIGQWEDGIAQQSHGSAPKVAIIVPIRDAVNALSQGVGRWKNADELVEHMCTFLPKAEAPLFDVIFVEQSDDGNPFNKGVLFNAGYLLTLTEGYSHMVLHDVDQVPENTKNSYGHPGKRAVHLLTATSQWNYTPMHKDTVGGALSLSHEVYAAVGGYSNLFWGWGGEDNNMYTRLNNGPGVRRPKLAVGRYKALFHPRVMGLDETEQFKNNHKIIHKLSHEAASDGIATVKYKELHTRHRLACSGANSGNSVVIHTIDVLNTENLHPDAAGSPSQPAPPPPPPPPPKAGAPAVVDASAAASAAGASALEATFEIAIGFDCEGNDIEQHTCESNLSPDACVAEMHVHCLGLPKCIGFNFPGGWLKDACDALMRFPETTLYIHQKLLAQRKAEMPTEEDDFLERFKKISVLQSASPVEMFLPCTLRVVPSNINLATGGESIDAVYGRTEEEEYPHYKNGAFVAGCQITDHSHRARKTVDSFSRVKNAISVVSIDSVVSNGRPCTNVLGNDKPGVFMQRYEYANLYHTMLDWASLYETMQAHDLKRDDFQLVWLDGHAAGALDEAWKLMFSKHVTFVKHLPDNVCYSPAYFPADGSKSDLFAGCKRGAAKAGAFAKYALEELGLLDVPLKRSIVVIDRKPYMSHPRLRTPLPSVTSRSWDNIDEILHALKVAFPQDEVKLVDLASHSFVEQVEIIRSAWGVVGMHGAAMAYMIFMSPNSHLVEFSVKSPKMFKQFALCTPWVHHSFVELGLGKAKDHARNKAYNVPPARIVNELSKWAPP